MRPLSKWSTEQSKLSPKAIGNCLRPNEDMGEAGIFNRPTFDLNGQRLIGAQPYDTFAAAIDSLLP